MIPEDENGGAAEAGCASTLTIAELRAVVNEMLDEEDTQTYSLTPSIGGYLN